MDKNLEILEYFPAELKNVLKNISEKDFCFLNEINVTAGQPVTLRIKGKYFFLCNTGATLDYTNAFYANKEHINRIFEIITHSSAYAYKRFVNEGFLTLPEGHRVGICGTCITDKNEVVNLSHINSFCFRINHNIKGNIDIVIDDIFDGNIVKNTIIISPPGCGKTTFLRTVAGYLAGFNKNKIIKCSVIDERFEIASCNFGTSFTNIGVSSSVISGCKKSIAIPMVVRSMTPDVILTDELATKDDIEAIMYARASGCKIIATSHGLNEHLNELKDFKIAELFEIIVILSSIGGPGNVEKIIYGEK